MSFDHDYPQLAIDLSTFSRTLDSGAVDICLDYLRRGEIIGLDQAHLVCRLGEKLFHEGRAGDATECGRLAFAVAANDNDVAYFCAWLFSNCGCYAEAASAYERLLQHRPDWTEGYRHASGAFAAIGASERAIGLAITASDLAPENFDFAYHAGGLLLNAKRAEEAALYLQRAVSNEPHNPHALRALSAATHSLDQPAKALNPEHFRIERNR